jgi:hypothetical protein
MDIWDINPSAPEFIGLSVEAATALCRERGFEGPRVADLSGDGRVAFKSNLRPNRLNLWVVDGRVDRAAFF